MPPIITLPIHTIEQARALAGLIRAYIDGQSPDTNEGQDWRCTCPAWKPAPCQPRPSRPARQARK